MELGCLRWEIPGIDLSTPDWEAHKADLQARHPFRDFVYARVSTDRRRIWTRISGMPLFDSQGRFAGYHGVGRDISAQMRAADDLRIAQERLELALQGSQLCFWDLDLRTGSIYLSEGWSRFCGTGDEPTMTTLDALRETVHPDDIEGVELAFWGALRGTVQHYEAEHRSQISDGSYRWLYSRGKVSARDAGGRAVRMTGTNLDIDERYRMQETVRAALREQETLMETCPTGLAILRDGRFVHCNPAAAHLLGYEPGELTGESIQIMFSEDRSWEGIRSLLGPGNNDSGSFSVELELMRKDGARVWALLSGHLIDLHSQYGILSLIDVTAQRNLASALTEAKEAADSASRAKSGFLAVMSHEIRTPMNGVLGLLELLELGGLEASQRETIHTVRGLANSLLSLIDDILDFSKIEAGQLAIRPDTICVADLVRQSCAVYQELALRKGLQLTQIVDPSLAPAHVGDGVRIRQILGNFLSNAVKFTDAGRVTVSAGRIAAHDTQESIRICVADTGIGISAEDQGKLFQPFVQVDSRPTRRFGGTGLGLSICKRLAQAMGGEVTMASSEGYGTEISLCLTLPVADASIKPQENTRAVPPLRPVDFYLETRPRAANEPILIADDHVVNLRLLERQLELLGFCTESARDGAQALQMWRRGRYSLLITDCHMPNMDGYQLARAIRTAEKTLGIPPMPIVACTADALAGNADQCVAAGMNEYIAKPVTLAALQSVLGRWMPSVRPALPVEGAPTQKELFHLPPIDPNALFDFSGGDPAAEREILMQFLEANNEDSSILLDAMDKRDLSAVLHASHRIKGACRAIGAAPLGDICEHIESSAKKHEWAGVIGARRLLETETSRLAEHLRLQVDASSAGTPTPRG